MIMIELFNKRAKKRNVIAYMLLGIAILIIFLGIMLLIISLDEVGIEGSNVTLSVISRLSFVALLLFSVQILLKHYRYNILKADYYLACADALKLVDSLEIDKVEKYVKILPLLISEKINLDNTESPNLQILNAKP